MSIQVFLLAALAIVAILTWRRAFQQSLRFIEAAAWTLVWIGAAIIVSLPGITTIFAQTVGIGRGADLVIYLATFLLFLLVFHLHLMHDRMERTLTEIVRQEALQQLPESGFEKKSNS